MVLALSSMYGSSIIRAGAGALDASPVFSAAFYPVPTSPAPCSAFCTQA